MDSVPNGNEDDNAALADAEAVVARLIPLTGPNASEDLQDHLAAAWLRQIELLRELDRLEEAATAAEAMRAHFDTDVEPVPMPRALWIVQAQHQRSRALLGMGEFGPAAELMKTVRARFGRSDVPEVREVVAVTGVDEARLVARGNSPFAKVDMTRYCALLIDTFGKDERVGTRVAVAQARALQAELLADLDDPEAALASYNALHDELAAAADPELREEAGDALLAEARLLTRLGRRDAARDALRRVIAFLEGATHRGQRETLALAQLDYALDLWRAREEGPYDAAADAPLMDALDAVVRDHEESDDGVVLRSLNAALRLKAQVLRTSPSPADRMAADALTDGQWARFAGYSDPQIQHDVILAMLDRLDPAPPEEAAEGYRRIIARFGDSDVARLQGTLARTRVLEAWALRMIERDADALAALDAMDAHYAQAVPPDARSWLVRGRIERARLLRDQEDYTAALAALDGAPIDEEAEGDGEESSPALRRAIADALAMRVVLWEIQVPPAPVKAEGEKEQAASGPPDVAQLKQAIAVKELCARFAADASAEIRESAARALYDFAVNLRRHRHFQRAADQYFRYLQLFADDTAPAIEALTASVYLNYGYLLMELMGRADLALPIYDALLARFSSATSDAMRATLAKAGSSRLSCLNRLQRQGVNPDYGDAHPGLSLEQRDAIGATVARGRALLDDGKYREAIAVYDTILAEHVEALHPELRRRCAQVMVRKAFCLSKLDQREEALAVSDELIARYGNDLSTQIEEDVALAMNYRASQLDKLGRHDEEVATYDAIITLWATSDVAYLRERVASARFRKAVTIADKDLDNAIALYRQVMLDLDAREQGIRLLAAKAAVEASKSLRGAGRDAEASAVAETLAARCKDDADPAIARLVARGRIGLVEAYGRMGQTDAQVEQIEILLKISEAALRDSERTSLREELRRLRPPRTMFGKAAQALGDYFAQN